MHKKKILLSLCSTQWESCQNYSMLKKPNIDHALPPIKNIKEHGGERAIVDASLSIFVSIKA